MTKRRVINQLMFKTGGGLKPGSLKIAVALTGTGTSTANGILTLIASNVATSAYLTISGTGTLIGTGAS